MTISAGIPYALLLKIEAIRFPTLGFLLEHKTRIPALAPCFLSSNYNRTVPQTDGVGVCFGYMGCRVLRFGSSPAP